MSGRFRGAIDGVTDRQVRGWVVEIGNPEPVAIRLVLHGRAICDLTADRPRRDIEAVFQAPLSGFVVDLPPDLALTAGDVLEGLKVIALCGGEEWPLPLWNRVRDAMASRVEAERRFALPSVLRPVDIFALERIELDAVERSRDPAIVLPDGDRPTAFAGPGARFHDRPQGTMLFDDLTRQRQVMLPPAGLASVRDCILVGSSIFITPDGRCFSEIAFPGEAHIRGFFDRLADATLAGFHNHNSGIERQPQGADETGLMLRQRLRSIRPVEEPALVISSLEPSNYGAFLFRVLPKLRWAARFPHVRVFCEARHPAMERLIEMAGVPADRLIRQERDVIYVFRHALIPTMSNYEYVLDRESRELFARIRRGVMAGPPTTAKAIYVSRMSHNRSNPGYRNMRNEAELVRALIARGVAIVEPERLSAEDQIRAFGDADLVVGPSGAGMFNTVFCRPGSWVVDIESEPHWGKGHANLFSSCGLNYGIVEARADANASDPTHRNFEVDVEAVARRVDWILERIATGRDSGTG